MNEESCYFIWRVMINLNSINTFTASNLEQFNYFNSLCLDTNWHFVRYIRCSLLITTSEMQKLYEFVLFKSDMHTAYTVPQVCMHPA